MKIAICISGQPRSWKEGFEYLEKNLLSKHDYRLFYHSWEPYDVEEIDETYLPVSRQIESSPRHLMKGITSKYSRVADPKYPAFNTWSMWYSVYKANELRKEYELHHNYTFDAIVRTRFDYALNREIDFETMNTDKLYVPNCRVHPGKLYCSDMFAYGTPHIMNLYSNVYNNIDFLYNAGFRMNGEDMLSGNLQLYGLVGNRMEYVDMNNPFPPGPYNGNAHSIIRDDFKDWNKDR